MSDLKDKVNNATIILSDEFSKLENKIIFDIVRRIKKTGKITSTADYQLNKLRSLGWSTAEIEKMLMDYLDLTYEQLFILYDEVEQSGFARDSELYTIINENYQQDEEWDRLIDAIKEQTNNSLTGIAQSAGFRVLIDGHYVVLPFNDYVNGRIDRAIFQITSGAFDYDTILKDMVREMTSKGICIEIGERIYNLNSFVTISVMTAISQLQGVYAKKNAEILGTDLFEVDWHATARPSHQPWQGKVYTSKELKTVCGEGTKTGLKGYNCYHYYTPFVKGRKRQWSDEWIEEHNKMINEKRKFQGKDYTLYELTQKQRYIERIMKKQRQNIVALQKGGYDEKKLAKIKGKYQTTLNYYKHFCNSTRLTNQISKVYRDGLGRVL